MILVAARPAMGKSAFALNIATNAALQAKVPVVIFNLEMSKSQLVNRILCSEAMVDSNKIRTGKIEEDDWVKLATALRTTFRSPYIYRRYTRNYSNRNTCKMQKTKNGKEYRACSYRLFTIDTRKW